MWFEKFFKDFLHAYKKEGEIFVISRWSNAVVLSLQEWEDFVFLLKFKEGERCS